MHKKLSYPILLVLCLLVNSCDTERDKVSEISKDGSIETVMNVEHLNDHQDIIKTTHKVWVKNLLVKTAVHTDTVPSLGLITATTEPKEGQTKEVAVKKDYEIYITVK